MNAGLFEKRKSIHAIKLSVSSLSKEHDKSTHGKNSKLV
jgi:hypothetical protein